jgi:predicted amino acid-binding ACT domain protein
VVARLAELERLLGATTLPDELVGDLLDGAPPLWLLSGPAPLLGTDLVLCHPPLARGEVRAVAQPTGDGTVRLTVAAHDRAGLLADTAGTLTAHGLSITGASAGTWTDLGLAVHALTVASAGVTDWDALSADLRRGKPPRVDFAPLGRADVTCSPGEMGRSLMTVSAADQPGLLWAVCRWLADHGQSIEAAHVGGVDGRAEDSFVVVGAPDAVQLAQHLSGPATGCLGGLLSFARGR